MSEATQNPTSSREWCKQIIEGSGGMNDYESREVVVWHDSDRVCGAHWALKCLANPKCEGSDYVLQQILEIRGQADEGNSLAERVEELERLRLETCVAVCQTLGKALGLPRFCDDQKNFPGATEADGVCVVEHDAESIAESAAKKIADLERQVARLVDHLAIGAKWMRWWLSEHACECDGMAHICGRPQRQAELEAMESILAAHQPATSTSEPN